MLRELITTSRPLSWINTAYPFAAAYWMVTREIDAALIVGSLFFLIPYNVAMYGINDVFDYASDLANPRKGGAEGAVLQPRMHRITLLAAAVLCLPPAAVLVTFGSWPSWIVLGISLFAVVAYSAPGLRFKEKPFLDSITSSTHFVSPAVYGLILAGAEWHLALYALLAAFFLWGMASHAFGAVQDVVPDRAVGIGSISTVLGAARTVRLALAAWVAAGLLMLLTGWPGAVAALFVLPYLALAAPFARITDEDSGAANRGWRRFLGANYLVGFLVTMLLIAVAW